MLQYTVRSGQNLYDVALTLHGSVEGIFDLLASNDWLTLETVLSHGMILNYHEEFVLNNTIKIWLKENNIVVKNGEHSHNVLDVAEIIETHIVQNHPDIISSLAPLSADEKNMFWETQYQPRILIRQQGILSGISFILKNNTHLVIDWGDYSEPQLFEGEEQQEIEHCYKGAGTHIITLYGDCEFNLLDLREINGIYFPLSEVNVSDFKSKLESDAINNKLIITK